MADLDSLGIKSITDMTTDEALEHLRQIRLSRRVPVKETTRVTRKQDKPKPPTMTAEQAAELLKLLQGSKK